MLYSVDDLKSAIRVALDQNMTSDQLFETEDIDTLSLDEIIESKIADAARIVENEAPQHRLEGGEPFGDSVVWDSRQGYGPGYVILPDDFLRLVSFKMSDWDIAVTTPITADDPLYFAQRSRFPGVRGNPQAPVVAITTRPVGTVLEFFSCTAGPGTNVAWARYIPIPKITAGQIPISSPLRDAVVYYAASMVAELIGQADLAVRLQNTAKDLMK